MLSTLYYVSAAVWLAALVYAFAGAGRDTAFIVAVLVTLVLNGIITGSVAAAIEVQRLGKPAVDPESVRLRRIALNFSGAFLLAIFGAVYGHSSWPVAMAASLPAGLVVYRAVYSALR